MIGWFGGALLHVPGIEEDGPCVTPASCQAQESAWWCPVWFGGFAGGAALSPLRGQVQAKCPRPGDLSYANSSREKGLVLAALPQSVPVRQPHLAVSSASVPLLQPVPTGLSL